LFNFSEFFIFNSLLPIQHHLVTGISNSIRPDQEFETIQFEYSYKNLKLNDLDQMMDLMYEKLKEYKKAEQVQKLKEGAYIAFSRPNEDRTLDKIISIVRNPLEDNNEWENTVEAMVQQSLATMKNENEEASRQATAGVVLENVIADFKPLFIKQYHSGGFETEMIEKIAASQVVYSQAAISERRLNLMRNNGSPSEIAIKLLDLKNESLNNEKK
jgi:hypothetical protein